MYICIYVLAIMSMHYVPDGTLLWVYFIYYKYLVPNGTMITKRKSKNTEYIRIKKYLNLSIENRRDNSL